MENSRSLAGLLASLEPKDTGIMLRVPESEKQQIQNLADSFNINLSDFIRQAIYYYSWATSEIELKTIQINKDPEFIDLKNVASYSIYLANYLITDDTFDSNETRTNKHRHSFHFAPLTFHYLTGARQQAILYPGETVRVYTGSNIPKSPPVGISIWTSLPSEQPIWNNQIERVTVYRIARKESEDIIAGIPTRNLGGLKSLLKRYYNNTNGA